MEISGMCSSTFGAKKVSLSAEILAVISIRVAFATASSSVNTVRVAGARFGVVSHFLSARATGSSCSGGDATAGISVRGGDLSWNLSGYRSAISRDFLRSSSSLRRRSAMRFQVAACNQNSQSGLHRDALHQRRIASARKKHPHNVAAVATFGREKCCAPPGTCIEVRCWRAWPASWPGYQWSLH